MKRNFFKITAVALLLTIIAISCKEERNVIGVSLNTIGIVFNVGETETLIASVYPVDAANKAISWSISDPAVASVVDGKVTAKEVGMAIITVTTDDGNHTAKCGVKVTPAEDEGVVINGVRWATRNVAAPGKFVPLTRDMGMLYQWNRKVGWSAYDPMINSDGGTTWDSSDAEGDTWETVNDPCPPGWRVPTSSEFESLENAGSWWSYTTGGMSGRIFGSSDNTLFLPAAGNRYYGNGMRSNVGSNGYYWSSSTGEEGTVFGFVFLNTHVGPINTTYRNSGFSIRCVAE